MRKLTFLTALLAWCVSWGQQEARFQTSDGTTGTTIQVRSSVACAVGTYTDRASFEAEAGVLPMEDWSNGPFGLAFCDGPFSSAGNSCFGAGEILDGIEITSLDPLMALDPMVFLDAGAVGNADRAVATNDFNSDTVMNFPNGDVNAFGADLYALMSGTLVTINIYNVGGDLIHTELFDVMNGNPSVSGPVFYGHIAAEPIGSVEFITDPGFQAVVGLANVAFGSCSGGGSGNEWTVHVWDNVWGDEVSWELRDSGGNVLLSVVDGTYGNGYDDVQTVTTSDEPLEFYIEAMGTFGDNTPDYEILCSGNVIVSGFVVGGTEVTESDLFCSAGGGGGCTEGVYTDRGSFDAEAGVLPIEDWSNGPFGLAFCDGPFSSAGNSCFAAGEILEGIEITSLDPLMALDPMVFLDAGAVGNADRAVATNDFNSDTVMNFPNGDVNAFGADLYTFMAGTLVTINIYNVGGDLLHTEIFDVMNGNPSASGPVFYGYIADEPIGSVEFITDPGFQAVVGLANVAFGNCGAPSGPANDTCETAGVVNCGDVVVGTTADNTDTGGNAAPDEWYSYTGSGDAENVTISLCDGGTSYDSYIRVFDACGGNEIAFNDDFCGLQSELTFESDGTTTYYIMIEGFGSNSGDFSMAITCETIGGGGGGGCTEGAYTDRASFDAEAGALPIEDWSNGPFGLAFCDGPFSSAGNSCFAAGEILDGIEVTSLDPLLPLDPMVFLDAGAVGNADRAVATNDFNSDTVMNFPNGDVNAFGADLYTFMAGTLVTINIYNVGGDLIHTELFDVMNGNPSPSGPVFYGYIASEPIGSVEFITDPGFQAVVGLANVAFGTCSNAAPDFDTCETAGVVNCGDVITGTTDDNTDTAGNAAADEWYAYTGTGDAEMVTVSLCDGGTSYDSVLRVFDACNGTEIAFNDDFCGLQSELSFFSDGTTTYYIMIEGFGSNTGDFSMAVTCEPMAVNDDCEDALPIACGDVVSGSTANATEDNAPECVTTNTAPGVWYVYEDTSGLLNDILLSTCSANTDYDTKISVYEGDCGDLICVSGNDDSPNCTNFQSEVEFQSDGNTTYYILVHGFGSATGNFELSMSCVCVAPDNDDIANSNDADEVGFPYLDPAVAGPCATEEAASPADCDNAGVQGFWYNFTPEADGLASCEVITPAGYTHVSFYAAPSENATEDELVLVDYFDNQCVPENDATIPVVAGQAYYVYVANTGGVSDVVIDGTFYLGANDNQIEGFTFAPNPANNVVTLSSVELIEQVEFYNVLGQKVVSLQANALTQQVDVSSLATGTYIMQVTVNGKLGTYKLIKE